MGTLVFPHAELTVIVGKPTNSSIQLLQRLLFTNARSVPSPRGGGNNGHLAIVMNNAAYDARAGVPFVVPNLLHQYTHLLLRPHKLPKLFDCTTKSLRRVHCTTASPLSSNHKFSLPSKPRICASLKTLISALPMLPPGHAPAPTE
jgi:hypothetical protein